MEQAQPYVVLVPVKPPAQGKSRLGPAGPERRELAAAFALDTVAACLEAASVAEVLAVTDDAAFASELAATGCSVLPDGVAEDLNTTLRLAAAEAHRRWPSLQPVAVCADLPALRAADLESALQAAAGAGAVFVSDAAGTGTTLYSAPVEEFVPHFGPHSRAEHLADGAREVDGPLPTLRQDVDDAADLERAAALGLGRHTAALTGR